MKRVKSLLALSAIVVAFQMVLSPAQARPFVPEDPFVMHFSQEKVIGHDVEFKIVPTKGSTDFTCFTTFNGGFTSSACHFTHKFYAPGVHTADVTVLDKTDYSVHNFTKTFTVDGEYKLDVKGKFSAGNLISFKVFTNRFNVQESPLQCSFYVNGVFHSSANCQMTKTFTAPGTYDIQVKLWSLHEGTFMTLSESVLIGTSSR